MTWLVPKLKDRLMILKPIQTPNADTGGFDQTYETLMTIWSGINQVIPGSYIRGVQVDEATTHLIIMRYSAIKTIGRSFSSGFSTGFDSIPDLTPLKSDLFLFEKRGSTSKGKLFRVRQILNYKNRDEYLQIHAEEIEEQGTGMILS